MEEGSHVADPVQGIPLDCIRKIADEVLVIPGRFITLMDTVGQGILKHTKGNDLSESNKSSHQHFQACLKLYRRLYIFA